MLDFALLAMFAVPAAPTYAKDVAPIIQKNCEYCHRPGQIGPFPFTKYEEVAPFATEIKRVVSKRVMPPWHAERGHGEFLNERRLSDDDVATLVKWAGSGTPKGDPKDLPKSVNYPPGKWILGPPDFEVKHTEPYELEPEGRDEYRCFVVPTNFPEDRWVQAQESMPDNRRVVHHILVYTDISGNARKLDAADPKPGFNCFGGLKFMPQSNFGGWAPGEMPAKLPEHIGRYLPKGADIVYQVHYHKDGRKAVDHSSVGLHFNKGKVTERFVLHPVLNGRIKIPAGAEYHKETSAWTAPYDVTAYSVFPHMHLLGKEMRMVATLPDGTLRDLVWVKNYDFNWQNSYVFRDPMKLPKGTRIDVTAYFNNSETNAANPNKPLRDVGWGDATTDEMLIGWVSYAIPATQPIGQRAAQQD